VEVESAPRHSGLTYDVHWDDGRSDCATASLQLSSVRFSRGTAARGLQDCAESWSDELLSKRGRNRSTAVD
jgi:hypothetical protein